MHEMNNKKHEASESKGKPAGKGKDLIKGDYNKMEALMRGKPSAAKKVNYKGR